jgi:hypothetical protein
MNGPDEGRNAVQVVEGVIHTEPAEGPHKESLRLAPTDHQKAGQSEPNRDKKRQGRKLATKTKANQELPAALPQHESDHIDQHRHVTRQSL